MRGRIAFSTTPLITTTKTKISAIPALPLSPSCPFSSNFLILVPRRQMVGSTSSFSPPRPNPALNLSAKGQGGDRQTGQPARTCTDFRRPFEPSHPTMKGCLVALLALKDLKCICNLLLINEVLADLNCNIAFSSLQQEKTQPKFPAVSPTSKPCKMHEIFAYKSRVKDFHPRHYHASKNFSLQKLASFNFGC